MVIRLQEHRSGENLAWGKYRPVQTVRLPFEKKTSEYDTGFNLPDKCIVHDVEVEVVTNVAASTIDVGTLSSGTNGDADGLIDGASCATAGFPTLVASGAVKYGVFMIATDQSGSQMRTHKSLPTADEKSITYTTSDHDVTGYIYVTFTDLTDMESDP